MLKQRVHQARKTFGSLLGLAQGDQSVIQDQTTFELETHLSPEIGSSLPMYYAFYYQPLFRAFSCQNSTSEIFPGAKINAWIQKIRLASVDSRQSSLEAHALFDLATNGNEFVWTMTTIIAGLNACLTSEEAILVLSTAFSLRYDPRCVLPLDRTLPSTAIPDLPSREAQLFDHGSSTALQRPRYDLVCTLGRRLKEDYLLMSYLANVCGLQEEISRKLNVGYQDPTEQPKIDLILALVALASQPSSWGAWRQVLRRPMTTRVCFLNRTLVVHPSASRVVAFLYAIQSAGISITIHDQPYQSFQQPSDQMQGMPRSECQAWYQSHEYNSVLKNESWWPRKADYVEWQREINKTVWEKKSQFQGLHMTFENTAMELPFSRYARSPSHHQIADETWRMEIA